jgi:hypothetical protein
MDQRTDKAIGCELEYEMAQRFADGQEGATNGWNWGDRQQRKDDRNH